MRNVCGDKLSFYGEIYLSPNLQKVWKDFSGLALLRLGDKLSQHSLPLGRVSSQVQALNTMLPKVKEWSLLEWTFWSISGWSVQFTEASYWLGDRNWRYQTSHDHSLVSCNRGRGSHWKLLWNLRSQTSDHIPRAPSGWSTGVRGYFMCYNVMYQGSSRNIQNRMILRPMFKVWFWMGLN